MQRSCCRSVKCTLRLWATSIYIYITMVPTRVGIGSIVAIQTGGPFLDLLLSNVSSAFSFTTKAFATKQSRLAAFCSLAYLNVPYMLLPLFLSFRMCNCRIYGTRHLGWSLVTILMKTMILHSENNDVDACIVLTFSFFFMAHGRLFFYVTTW
jgi:hypothetical protein